MFKSIIFLLLILTTKTYALKLSPMVGYLKPSGSQSSFSFTATNQNTYPEAMIVKIEYRNSKDQEKYGKKADSLFQIFPKKAILMPKSSGKPHQKDIKIIWKGGEIKDIERSFRLIVEQVPLNFSKKKVNGGKMQIVPRYIASVYVAPDQFKPEAEIISKKIVGNKLKISMKNTGLKHHLFKDLLIKVKSNNDVKKLKPNQMQGIFLHSIQAKSTREFEITLPREFRNKNIKSEDVEIKF